MVSNRYKRTGWPTSERIVQYAAGLQLHRLRLQLQLRRRQRRQRRRWQRLRRLLRFALAQLNTRLELEFEFAVLARKLRWLNTFFFSVLLFFSIFGQLANSCWQNTFLSATASQFSCGSDCIYLAEFVCAANA